MSTGDTLDMAARIRSVLPTSWFPTSAPGGASSTPVLDGVLAGLGSGWAAIYCLLTFAKLQTRIATATGFFLDLIALDFFADGLARRSGETDAAFQARIRSNIFAPRGTRAALALTLTNLTGRAPTIFEPANTQDTGGYGTEAVGGGGMGYCRAGGYGSLQLPFQCFVTAFRPMVGGIAQVAGYDDGDATPTFAPGAATARSAPATYLDQDGVMRIAAGGQVRPLYSGGLLTGLLLEPAGINLIPDSLSFGSNWSTSGASGAITPSAAIPPLFAGATILQFSPVGSGARGNWSLGALPASPPYTASVWVWLPEGFQAASCQLDANNGDPLSETQVAVDQTVTGRWQRVSLLFNHQGAETHTGFQVSGANLPAYICCWQFEPGGGASSYIPTANTAATRDPDVPSNTLPGAGAYGLGAIEYADLGLASAQVTDAEIYAAIAAVMPAATIAWTRISN